MKTVLVLTAMAGLLALPARGQYTFGPEQNTPSGNITYNSANGVFQYTDPDSDEDTAGLPLTGSAANLITSSNDWTASITINVSARTMGGVSEAAPFVYMGLVVYTMDVSQNRFIIECGQVNNTAGDDSDDVPDGFYGTDVRSSALNNGNYDVVAPLGNSQRPPESADDIYLILSGTIGAPDTPVSEAINAVSGVLTLSYQASTQTATAYYNGAAIGSYPVTGWGANPPLTLAVFGGSEEGAIVPTNTDTATNFNVGPGTFSIPQLTAVRFGANNVLMWPTNAGGFTLQSTTNPGSPAAWSTVSPAPVVVNGQNAVTNRMTGPQQFFRLTQP